MAKQKLEIKNRDHVEVVKSPQRLGRFYTILHAMGPDDEGVEHYIAISSEPPMGRFEVLEQGDIKRVVTRQEMPKNARVPNKTLADSYDVPPGEDEKTWDEREPASEPAKKKRKKKRRPTRKVKKK